MTELTFIVFNSCLNFTEFVLKLSLETELIPKSIIKKKYMIVKSHISIGNDLPSHLAQYLSDRPKFINIKTAP